MKKILKTSLAIVVISMAGMGAYNAYGSYVPDGMSEDDLLLAENVLALADPSSDNEYTGKAKDYTSGRGLYVVKVNAEGEIGLTVGMRLTAQAAANLKGKVEATMQDEFQMICQPNMGCYTNCIDIPWQAGKQSTRLDRGC